MKLDDLPDDSDRCWHCGAELPDDCFWGFRKYCSVKCQRDYHNAIRRELRRKARAGRKCAVCSGEMPVTKASDALTCSHKCLNRLRQDARLYRKRQRKRGRTCQHCGGPIPEARTLAAMYCGERCMDRARRARERASKVLR